MTDIDVERLDWADLPLDPAQIIRVWVQGSEVAWAEHAWSTLSNAELTSCDDEVERTTALIRLLALAAIYQDFCARAFEEGEIGGWREDLSQELFEAPQAVDLFSLGQLAERRCVGSPRIDRDDDSAVSHTVAELIGTEYQTVVGALVKAWGGSVLFATLWASREEDVVYPLEPDALSTALNSDLTSGKHVAFAWVEEGLPA